MEKFEKKNYLPEAETATKTAINPKKAISFISTKLQWILTTLATLLLTITTTCAK